MDSYFHALALPRPLPKQVASMCPTPPNLANNLTLPSAPPPTQHTFADPAPCPSPYRTQVESPGEYGSLEEYFRHYRSPQLAPPSFSHSESVPAMTPSSLKPDHVSPHHRSHVMVM